jgi:hypothetical protein
VLAFCAPLVMSQESTGSIRGTVTDQKGGAVAGATVTANSPALVRPVEVTSDGNGKYIFGSLPAGTYTVSASQAGFSNVQKDDIQLQLGRELSLDLALPVGGVTETVNVTAGTEAIDVTSSKTVTNIGEERINLTPKGRGFESILKLAPGVRQEPKAGNEGVGGISVDGASGAENAFILDGVEVTDVRKGQLRRADAIPFEFIREVQIKSGGFEAEYGGATGGVVNVVTKSGSNEFHGEGAFSFTNSALNSNFRGYWQIDPTNSARADFYRPNEHANDYYARYPGFSIGGPILKNRLTFFTSYFPEFLKTDRTVNYASGAKTFKQNMVRHYGLARLDYAPSSKIQINSSFIWTPTKVTGSLPSSDPRVAAPANDLRVQGGFTPSSSTSASVTYTPTSKWIISARFGYKYLNDKGPSLNYAFSSSSAGNYGLPGDSFREYFSNSSQQTSPAVPAQFAGSTGFRNVSPNFFTLRDITTRHNLYADVAYVATIAGQSHVLKGGYALNRLGNDVEDDYVNGYFRIFWGEGFSRGAISQARGTYGYYYWEDGVRHNAKVKSRNQGFYVQDAWKIHPRVNLNLGLRFENEFLPPYTPEVNGIKVANPVAFGWGDKIAPRLGGAWDVYGNGKWKLSANYGVYYDVMKYELARGSFGGDFWISHVYRLDNPNVTLLSKANPGALGSQIVQFDNRTVPINAQGELEGIDPAIKPYRQHEFTVMSEHQINQNNVLALRYTRKRLDRAIEDIGTLDADGNEVYVIGNPGFGQRSDTNNVLNGVQVSLKAGQSLFPKAVREYDAFEVRFDGRFSEGRAKNLSYFLSYTLSRLYGNYSGLANSDENGRSDPSVTRNFDLPYGNFDQNGNNVYGRLGTDRPHAFTAFLNLPVKSSAGITNFGFSQVAFSGSPVTSEATVIVPIFYNGRGDLGRTDVFTQTDLLVQHTYNITERVGLRFEANVQNVFNQAAVLNIKSRINRNGNITNVGAGSITDTVAGQQAFFSGGFRVPSLINPNNGSPSPNIDPVYGLPGTRRSGLTAEGQDAYQGIRQLRLGVRLIF